MNAFLLFFVRSALLSTLQYVLSSFFLFSLGGVSTLQGHPGLTRRQLQLGIVPTERSAGGTEKFDAIESL